jgi:ABC-type transport system involved in multi-copper enzyme maturation permease subunit
MVGPILHHEMLLGSRRSRAYVLRWIYAGWLVFELLFILLLYVLQGLGAAAAYFVKLFIVQQTILVVLMTPAFAAGALTEEKTRGTLQYLLTADVSSWHILVGKLIGRCFNVAVLALAGVPLLCFFAAVGGLDPLMAFLLAAGVTLPPLLAVGAASLLASVWSRRTLDAVIGLYVVVALALPVIWLVEGPLRYFDPFYALEPVWGVNNLGELVSELPDFLFAQTRMTPSIYSNSTEVAGRVLQSGLAWTALVAVCLGLAAWRLRPAYIRQLEGEGRKKARWWRVQRAPVPDEPIAWKERHVHGIAPVEALRNIPTWLGITAVAGLTTGSSVLILSLYLNAGATWDQVGRKVLQMDLDGLSSLFITSPHYGFLLQSILAMLGLSLLVGIRCSTSVSGEREKKTWEALLLTPLTARQLIRGKVWGIMGSSYLYLAAYAVPALALSLVGGLGSFFWVVIWLAVTWLAMYFVSAAGIWCSVRNQSSWRSLLWTLGMAYAGGFAIYCVTSPVVFILTFFIYVFLMLLDQLYGTATTAMVGFADFATAFFIASCIGLAAMFWLLALYFLSDARKWIADRERTRHWKDEPGRLPPRRRPVKQRYYR